MANAPIIGGLFKSPAPPAPVAVPVVASPTSADPAAAKKTQDDMEAAAAAQRKIGGSASDIMTGGAGLSTQPKTSSNILLGN